MKVVILAGGLGTRLSEETLLRPKPMVEIGGKPILWHIMQRFSLYGHNDFVICLGYKGYIIKEYFANYFLHNSDVTFDMARNQMIVHKQNCEPWRVTLLDTGQDTMTGGRLRRVRSHLESETQFFFTYGDGVGDVDLQALLAFHQAHGKLATLTAVQPPGRYGVLTIEGAHIKRFQEKPAESGGWINGGYFVLSPKAIGYIEDDHTTWEHQPMEALAREGQLTAFQHHGFWQCMDTLRDKTKLEEMWDAGKAVWLDR